jgi:hypothetical protein
MDRLTNAYVETEYLIFMDIYLYSLTAGTGLFLGVGLARCIL